MEISLKKKIIRSGENPFFWKILFSCCFNRKELEPLMTKDFVDTFPPKIINKTKFKKDDKRSKS